MKVLNINKSKLLLNGFHLDELYETRRHRAHSIFNLGGKNWFYFTGRYAIDSDKSLWCGAVVLSEYAKMQRIINNKEYGINFTNEIEAIYYIRATEKK